jgi:hypothetical protein
MLSHATVIALESFKSVSERIFSFRFAKSFGGAQENALLLLNYFPKV